MGLAEIGEKIMSRFPPSNEIPEHFVGVPIDRHKALTCTCDALTDLWLTEVITNMQNTLFQALRQHAASGMSGMGQRKSLEGTKRVVFFFFLTGSAKPYRLSA